MYKIRTSVAIIHYIQVNFRSRVVSRVALNLLGRNSELPSATELVAQTIFLWRNDFPHSPNQVVFVSLCLKMSHSDSPSLTMSFGDAHPTALAQIHIAAPQKVLEDTLLAGRSCNPPTPKRWRELATVGQYPRSHRGELQAREMIYAIPAPR